MENDFSCKHCGKSFKNRGGLNGHIRFSHKTAETPATLYKDINPDVVDAEYRLSQRHLAEENEALRDKLNQRLHRNSVSNA